MGILSKLNKHRAYTYSEDKSTCLCVILEKSNNFVVPMDKVDYSYVSIEQADGYNQITTRGLVDIKQSRENLSYSYELSITHSY